MKTFEIRVTNEDDSNDFATTPYISEEPDTSAQDIINRLENHINHDGVKFQSGDKFVVIEPATDDEGYMYDVYKSRNSYSLGEESIDGGQCTGTLSDAIEMAIN